MSKDKELESLKEWQGQEETSNQLDENILAMAEQHLKQKELKASGGNWWRRLRVPVSVAAGLVVTLGVARLMMVLSGEDMNNMAQIASSEQIEQRYAIEMEADAKQEELALQREAKERSRLAEREMMAPPATIQEPELPKASDLVTGESIVVTGARIKQVDNDENQQRQEESVQEAGAESVSGQQAVGFDEHGVLDEAVLGYPLPEVWIEEIEQALADGDEILALDQWGQFKRTYPEYEVDENLRNRIKTLQKLQDNP